MRIQASSNGDQTRVEREEGEKWADSGYVIKVITTGRSDAEMIEPSTQVFIEQLKTGWGELKVSRSKS